MDVSARFHIFNTILKIYCRSFSIDLAVNGAEKKAFKAKIRWPNNTKSSKSLSRFLNKEINLKKIELNGLNTKLGL